MAKKELIEIEDLLPKWREWNMGIVFTSQAASENVAALDRHISERVFDAASRTVSQDPHYPHLETSNDLILVEEFALGGLSILAFIHCANPKTVKPSV